MVFIKGRKDILRVVKPALKEQIWFLRLENAQITKLSLIFEMFCAYTCSKQGNKVSYFCFCDQLELMSMIWEGLARLPDASMFATLTTKEPRVHWLSTNSRVMIASSKEA